MYTLPWQRVRTVSCFNMAATCGSSVNNSEQVKETEEYNPKLDFFSDEFDPLLALKTPNIKIPCPNARTYDNIHIYKSAHDKEAKQKQSGQQEKAGNFKTEKRQVAGPSTIERRWQPHQLPVKKEKNYNFKNIFTKMSSMEGPLALLTKCKEKKSRLKIWTRHCSGIRGYCLANLVAYDKHWNLALEDVTEVWTRPKKRKVPALDTAEELARVRRRVVVPKVKIVAETKKTETCQRHVEQLLLRGEHVAFIVVVVVAEDN